MLNLAKLLSFFPFTVNVFGRKRDLIVSVGNLLYSKAKLKNIEYNGIEIDLSSSEFFKIMAYATDNLFRDFVQSDLGDYMNAHLREGDRFIDIGANLGGYGALGMSIGLNVDLFEPVQELYTVLKRNEQFFGVVHGSALSDQNETVSFYTSSSNIGGSSLVESLDENYTGYDGIEEVNTKRFDDVFEEEIQNNQNFHLVKVDVEGNEFKTVSGMEGALKKGLVQALWCEVRGSSSDRNPKSYIEVSKLMETYNYKAYTYREQKLKKYDYHNDEAPQYFDLIYLKA